MKLESFKSSDTGREGGLSVVRLMSARDITEAKYDKQSGCYTEFVLTAGATPAIIEFEEDKAYYRQVAQGEYPLMSVVHELSLQIAPANAEAMAFITQLCSLPEGVVAVVVTASGDSLVVGLSPEFEREATLRLKSCVADTLSEYCDDSYGRITLVSEDVSLSKPFVGRW